MPDILITEAEQEVLARCSGTAVKAYLRLRSRMDLASGVVGVKSGLSYQALREWTEEAVEKGAGEEVVQPSMRNIRTAVEQLVRRGLLRRAKTQGLVFCCVLARTPEIRPKHTRHEPDRAKQHEPDTEPDTNPTGAKPSNGAAFEGFDRHEPDTEPDTNPTWQNRPYPTNIGVRGKQSTSQAASTSSNGVDAGGGLSAAFGLARKMVEPAQVEDGPMSAAIGLVALLHKRGARLQAMDPRVLAWYRDGIPEALVLQAFDVARDRRGASGQPVNAGLIDAIVRDLVERHKSPAKPKDPPWWSSDELTLAKGREVGLEPRPGEDWPAFKARVRAKLPGGVAA